MDERRHHYQTANWGEDAIERGRRMDLRGFSLAGIGDAVKKAVNTAATKAADKPDDKPAPPPAEDKPKPAPVADAKKGVDKLADAAKPKPDPTPAPVADANNGADSAGDPPPTTASEDSDSSSAPAGDTSPAATSSTPTASIAAIEASLDQPAGDASPDGTSADESTADEAADNVVPAGGKTLPAGATKSGDPTQAPIQSGPPSTDAAEMDASIDEAARAEIELQQQAYEDRMSELVSELPDEVPADADLNTALTAQQREMELREQMAEAGTEFWSSADHYIQDGEIYAVTEYDQEAGSVTLERDDDEDEDGVVRSTDIVIDESGAQRTQIDEEHPDGMSVTDTRLQDSRGVTVERDRSSYVQNEDGSTVVTRQVENEGGPLYNEQVTRSETDSGTNTETITTQFNDRGAVMAVERMSDSQSNPVTLEDGSRMMERSVRVDVVDADGWGIENGGAGAGTHSSFERTVAILGTGDEPTLNVYRSSATGEGSALQYDNFEAISGTYNRTGGYENGEELLGYAVRGMGPVASMQGDATEPQLDDMQAATWGAGEVDDSGMPLNALSYPDGGAFGIESGRPNEPARLVENRDASSWSRPNGTLTGRELYGLAMDDADYFKGPDLVVFKFGEQRTPLMNEFEAPEQETVRANVTEEGERNFGALTIDSETDLVATGPDGEQHDDWRAIEQNGDRLVIARDGEEMTVSLDSITRSNIENIGSTSTFALDDEDGKTSYGWNLQYAEDGEVSLIRVDPRSGQTEMREVSADEFLELNSVNVSPLGDRASSPLVDSENVPGTALNTGELYGASGRPSENDINQGGLGDCYLLAALGAQAQEDPSAIMDLIERNSDGSYDVRIGDRTVQVTPDVVGGDNPAYQGARDYNAETDVLEDLPPLWPALIEKAYTVVHGDSYGDIEGGNAGETHRELFGDRPTATDAGDAPEINTDENILEQARALLAQNVPIMLSSNNGSDSDVVDTVVQGHALWVDRVVENEDGELVMYVRNPWGNTHPRPMTEEEIRENYRQIQVPQGSSDI